MKLKYYIISLVLATSCGYLASCSNDDDDKIVNSELTFGVDALRVKIGEENKTLIPVAAGEGQYNAFSLDENVAKATIENGEVFVEGFHNGSTHIVVSDAGGHYKRLPIQVYTTDELVLNMQTLDFNCLLGKTESNNQIEVVLGNGGYSVESGDERIRAEISSTVDNEGNETAKVIVRATASKEEYTGIVTVRDQSNCTAEVTVTVKASFDVFTPERIAIIKEITTDYCNIEVADLTGPRPSYWDYYINSGTHYTGEATENSTCKVGWEYGSSWYCYGQAVIEYPETATVGETVNGCTFHYVYAFEDSQSYPGYQAQIVRDDAEAIAVLFAKVDIENENIDYGYIVMKK